MSTAVGRQLSSPSPGGKAARPRRGLSANSNGGSGPAEEPLRPAVRQRLLDLAMEAIERGGEAAVRVADIARNAETGITSIYHHFGSREGLVEAAQVERIAGSYRELYEQFRRGFERCRDRDDFRALLLGSVRQYGSPEQAGMRFARGHAVGGAFGRPRLARRVGEFLDWIDASRGEILAEAQARGWMRADIDPVAASQWYSTLVFGRVLGDLDRKGWSSAEWIHITQDMIGYRLFGEVPAGVAKAATGRGRASAGVRRATRAGGKAVATGGPRSRKTSSPRAR